MTRFTRSRSLGGRQTPKTSKEEDGDQQASGQSPCQKKNQSKRQSSQTVAPNGGHKQETESTESQTAASESKAGVVGPDSIWMQFIDDLYPNLLNQTYCLPPIFFNRSPQNIQTIAGQTVIVRQNPGSSSRGQVPPNPPPPPAQVAGTVFVENPPYLRSVRVQESDQQDDSAQQGGLQALCGLPNQVMMVLSCLEFQKYLSNHTNPLHAAAIAQLPTIRDPRIPPYIADGECDTLVIHRVYGLVIGEIKSVGGNDFFRRQDPIGQTQLVIKQVSKAAKQLVNQEIALRHLVSDLPSRVRITKTLLLPSVTSGQLQWALSTSPPFLQMLCGALSLPMDVSRAVRHCLCQEDLGQPLTWWQTLHAAGPDHSMTDDLYRRLVARFCGPATTVDIPTASCPRKVVRSLGQAVAETGLIFSSLTLTLAQVALLTRQPEPRFLHLQGPPGTGKTVVLLLKALQCARKGYQVVISSGGPRSQAVNTLIEAQLRGSLDPAAAARVQRHCCNLDAGASSVGAAVSSLQQMMIPGSGPVLVVCDEVGSCCDVYIQFLIEVRARLPPCVSVWGSGVLRLARTNPNDKAPPPPMPPWLEVQTLQENLRCPPAITTRLKQSLNIQIGHIPPYVDPQDRLATEGPPVYRSVHEEGQVGHLSDRPWQCVTCADHVADVIIKQLRVGQPGHYLQFRDVWLLYTDADPRINDVMIQRLQQLHRLPVRVVTSSMPPGQADGRELALATSDQIMAARSDAVQGLERRVVLALGPEGAGWDLSAQSRCSGYLYIVGSHCDSLSDG
ncbi:hypothetical protein ACOMHN_055578 [Nucella lapillus]